MAEERTEFTLEARDAIRQLGDLGKSWEELIQDMQKAELAGEKFTKTGKKISETWNLLDKSGRAYSVTLNNLGKKTETLTAKVKESELAEQRKLEAVRASNIEAKKQLAVQKQLANQLDRKTTGRITQADFSALGATKKEIISFQQSRARLKELVIANKTSAAQIKRIASDVANHKIKVETGANRQIQQAILDVNRTMKNLGSTARSELAKHQEAQKKSNNLLGTFELSWKSIGKLVASRVISSAISRIFISLRQGVQSAVEFERSIARIQTIDVADLGYKEWSSQLRALSDDFGIELIDQTTAAYQALSNQVVRGAETFEFLASANRLARTGISTAEQAVNLLSSAINAYGDSAGNSEIISAKLFKAVELGRLKIEDIADSFGRVAVTGNQLGITLDQTLAALDALTKQGLKPTEAMAALNGVMQKLIKPTKQAKELFREMGYESGISATQALGFQGVLEAIFNEVQGNSKAFGELFGRIRGIRGAFGLAVNDFRDFKQALSEIGNAEPSFNKALKRINENIGQNLREELQQIKNFFTADVFDRALIGFSNLTGGVEKLSDAVEALVKLTGVSLVTAMNLFISRAIIAKATTFTWAGASIALEANLWRLRAALTSTAVAVGAMTALLTVGAIYWIDYANASEQAGELATAASNNTIKALKTQVDAQRRLNQEQKKTLKEYELARADFISKSTRQINEYYNDNRKTFVESIKKQKATALDFVENGINKLDSAIKKYSNSIRNTESDLRNIANVTKQTIKDTQKEEFELKLSKTSLTGQQRLIVNEINNLKSAASKQAETGDLLGFEESRKSIDDLTIRLRELRTENFRAYDAERLFTNERKQNALEEEAQRKQIQEIKLRELAADKASLASAKARKDDLKETVNLLKGFKLEDILDTKDTAKDLEKVNDILQKITTNAKIFAGTISGKTLAESLNKIVGTFKEQKADLEKLSDFQEKGFESDKRATQIISERDSLVDKELQLASERKKAIEQFQLRNVSALGGLTTLPAVSGGAAFGAPENPFTGLIEAISGDTLFTLDAFSKSLVRLQGAIDAGTAQQIEGAQLAAVNAGLEVAKLAETQATQDQFIQKLSLLTGVSQQLLSNFAGINPTIRDQAIAVREAGISQLTYKQRIDELNTSLTSMQTSLAVQNNLITSTNVLNTNVQGVNSSMAPLPNLLNSMGKALKDLLAAVRSHEAAAKAAESRAKKFLAKARSISSTATPVKNFFGGLVDWTPQGADTIPSLLQRGEHVIRASKAKGLEHELDFINRYGKLPNAVAAKTIPVLKETATNTSVDQSHHVFNINESKSAELTGIQIQRTIRRANTKHGRQF